MPTSPDIKNMVDAFRELDLTIGNGLIGESQLLEPARRALFIGLGGTGIQALRRLKRIIYQRYKHIDQSFSFIGIDTNLGTEDLSKDYMLLDKNEKIALTANEDFFNPKKRDQMSHYIREWLNEDVMYEVKGDGAGAKRAVARALLFNSINEVAEKFENTIKTIRKGDDAARIDIYILTGIGGGTGSGILLDTAYILRKILTGISHTLYGFIFMPDINTSNPAIPKATMDSIVPNAFAALKEIDYWMSLQSRDDAFFQQYSGSFIIENEKRTPFDYCWPLTATNAKGVYVKDPLNQASTVAAEIICAWIAFKEDGDKKNNFVEAFASNVDDYRRTFLGNFKAEKMDAAYPVCFNYTICGASVAKLPLAAINTYLACILFQKFSGLYEHAFDDKILTDLPKFCSDNTIAIDYKSIKKAIDSQFASLGIKLPDMSQSSYSDLFENDAEKDYLFKLNQIDDNIEAIKTKVVQDKKQVLEMAFRDIFLDPNKGPYYLDAFIQNGNTGLIPLLGSYKRNITVEKGRIANLEIDAKNDKDDKYRNGKRAWGLTKGNHVREYSAALIRYYGLKRDEKLCDACMSIYTELQEQLQKKVSAAYKATFGILEALSGTFKNNIKTFDSAVKVAKKDAVTEYSWDIFTMPEIVSLVTTTLNSRGFDEKKQTELLQDFLASLLDFIDQDIKRQSALSDWNDSSLQLDVNGFLADFVTNKFKELTQKTMKDYMNIIAQQSGMTLEAYLERQFKKMQDEATPLFNKPLPGAPTLRYGTIPLDDPDIKEAWDNYALGDSSSAAYPSVNSDTLVFITVGCAVPLYADKQLEQAEGLYNLKMKDASTNAAMRLVSATSKSREKGYEDELWDWRYLPSVIPTDERPEGSLRTQDRDMESTYKIDVDRLLAKKILRGNPATGKCGYIKFTADFDAINKAIFNYDEITSTISVSDLKNYKANLAEFISYIDGTAKSKEGAGFKQRFNLSLEVLDATFSASVYPEWNDPYHEVLTVYSRSLNIRRDLIKIEKTFDMLTEKISKVNEILKEIDDAAELAGQIVKGFLCGIFETNGRQWQYINKNGETEILARGMGSDKYPLYAMYEKFIAQKDLVDELKRIDNSYAAALDDVDLMKLDAYKIFREQFKTEYKTKDNNDVSDAQRYLLDKINEFIDTINDSMKNLGI